MKISWPGLTDPRHPIQMGLQANPLSSAFNGLICKSAAYKCGFRVAADAGTRGGNGSGVGGPADVYSRAIADDSAKRVGNGF